MAYSQPLVVDIFDELVDSIRVTGLIDSSSEVSTGVYSLIASNELKEYESISLDGVNYQITSVTVDGFSIEGVVGLDFAGLTWKALAPYFIHGHPLEITNRLNKMNAAVYTDRKYPLIALIQEFDQVRRISDDYLFSIATPNIIIVNQTKKDINEDERYEANFKNVLYPIYYDLVEAIRATNLIQTKEGNVFDHTIRESPYYGTEGANGNTANTLSDPLDALKIINTKFKIIKQNC